MPPWSPTFTSMTNSTSSLTDCHHGRLLHCTCLSDRAVFWLSVLSGIWWSVHQESSDLHLADSIEGHKTDVGIWESLGASVDLTQHLSSIRASEHWELPHGPVAVVIVSRGAVTHSLSVLGGSVSGCWVGELKAWGPSVVHNVLHLRIETFTKSALVRKLGSKPTKRGPGGW